MGKEIREEIKVNEYIRTKKGKIGKLIDIDIKNNAYYLDCKSCVSLEAIKNHKEKPIDLIEVGDYVNGDYVIQISKELNCVFIETTYYDELAGEEKHNFIKTEDIKSIVTHEQMEKISYKVGE